MTGMDLSLRTRSDGSFEVIEAGGEIDVMTAPRLREAVIDSLSRGRRRLIIDVHDVEFLDSTGLGVLVGALRRAKSEGGSLDIVCTNDRLLKIFEITGLNKVFGLHSSIEDARSAFEEARAAFEEQESDPSAQ